METLRFTLFTVTVLAVIFEAPKLRRLFFLTLFALFFPLAVGLIEAREYRDMPPIPRYQSADNSSSDQTQENYEPPHFAPYQRHDYEGVGEPLGGYSQAVGGDSEPLGRGRRRW